MEVKYVCIEPISWNHTYKLGQIYKFVEYNIFCSYLGTIYENNILYHSIILERHFIGLSKYRELQLNKILNG